MACLLYTSFPEGSYRLTGDIQLSADGTLIWLVVEGDVTFDLNGHILRATEGKRFQIDVDVYKRQI